MYNKTRGCSNSMLRYSDANSTSWISVLHSDCHFLTRRDGNKRTRETQLQEHVQKGYGFVVGGGWWLLVIGWWLLVGGGGWWLLWRLWLLWLFWFLWLSTFSSRYPLEPTCVGITNTPSVARASLELNMLETSALFRPVRTTVAMFGQRGSQGTQSREVTRKSVTSPFPSLSVSVSALIQDHSQRVQKLRCVLGVFQSNKRS